MQIPFVSNKDVNKFFRSSMMVGGLSIEAREAKLLDHIMDVVPASDTGAWARSILDTLLSQDFIVRSFWGSDTKT